MENENKFKMRSFTSVLMFIAMLVVAVTGIMLYISPKGRVAHAVNWEIFFLNKDQWTSLHTLFSYLLLIFFFFHLFFNWKTLMAYLKDKASKAFSIKKEWVIALLVNLLFLVLTLFELPPLYTVMEAGDAIKVMWEESLMGNSTMLPHTEEYSMKKFAQTYKMEYQEVVAIMKGKGFEVKDGSETVQEAADALGVTPFDVYKMITKDNSAGGGSSYEHDSSAPSGLGRRSVSELAEELGISGGELLQRAESKGLKIKSLDDKVKEAAEANGIIPSELYERLSAEK